MTFTALTGPSTAVNTSPPPASITYTATARAFADVLDTQDGGKFKVQGTTKVKGTPDFVVSRLVRLHDQLSGRVVRAQWSQAGTGDYLFDRIRSGVFYVVAFDHTGQYNGVIATAVASELM
jgi:hypothetical protein